MVIKKRVISGCVTVTGPPSAICFLNRGMTLPLLPSTLPKRTATKSVLGLRRFIICTTISHRRLEAPMMLVGFTALSVEISTNFFTPYFTEAMAIL